jgi:hypothetical protein
MPIPTRPDTGICECCSNPPTAPGMHLDHDHETGRFRGWLCSNCNTAIGKLGDTVDGVKRAILYLETAAKLDTLSVIEGECTPVEPKS